MGRYTTALFACLFVSGASAQQGAPLKPRPKPLTIEDLISDPDLRDAAVSPSGKFLAAALWRLDSDMIVVMDLDSKATKVLTNISHDVAGKNLNVRIENLFWKSDDRLLFRTSIWPDEHDYEQRFHEKTWLKLGERMFAINSDGGKLVRLLGDNTEGALDGAMDLGSVASYLPNDPAHVLLTVNGGAGLSLFKVDVNNGVGVLVEMPRQRIAGWWLDLDGHAVLRMEYLNGTIRILQHESGDEWKKVLSYRPNESEEHPDYELLGPSDQPGRFYVLARPKGKDRRGIYLYDVAKESFGEVLYENPVYDLESGSISRDGKRVVSYCYVVHVFTCQFVDPKIESHMRGIRKFFGDTVNVDLIDSSADDRTIVFLASGPSQAPTYFYYRVDQSRIEPIGLRRDALNGRPLPTGTVVKWQARDGVELSGYLDPPSGRGESTEDATGRDAAWRPRSARSPRFRFMDPVPRVAGIRGFPAQFPRLRRLRRGVQRKRLG